VQSGNDRHAARYRCAKLDLLLHLARQSDQFGAALCDQLLVGGDYRFPRRERAPDPVFGGLKSSHHLDHDIHV